MLRFTQFFLKAKWLTFSVLLTPFAAFAQVSLYVWDRGPEAAAIVIPVPPGMTPESVWSLSLKTFGDDAQLMELIPDRSVSPQAKDFAKLIEDPTEHALFLGNAAKDLELNSRVKNWTRLLRERKMKTFVLPAAIGHLLTPNERNQLYEKISANFALLLPSGGRDLAPTFYGAEVNGARNFNAKIDFYELELILAYVKAARGFVYATCRGLQATAVALGQKLNQDLPTTIGTSIDHSDNDHLIRAFKTTNNFAYHLFGSEKGFFIYSYHHQAVIFWRNGFLELAATSADGVPEILEFKNGRGFLIQSHPELTLNGKPYGDIEAAQKIFDWAIPYAKKTYRGSCSVSLKLGSPRIAL